MRVPGRVSHSRQGCHALVGTAADFVHIAAASVWLGGLAFLCFAVLPRRDVDELALVVPRFSLVPLVCVIALISAGTPLPWRIPRSFPAPFTPPFGPVPPRKHSSG